MLAIQINHARQRLQTMTKDFVGNCPDVPLYPSACELMHLVRNKGFNVKPSQLKEALKTFAATSF